MKTIREVAEDLLADYAHKAWSGWMEYLFTKGHFTPSGEFVINADSVKRWHRQMTTPYRDLPPNEKASDIKEADEIFSIICGDCGIELKQS